MYNHGMQNNDQDQTFYNLNRQFAGRGLAKQARTYADSYGAEKMCGMRGANAAPLTLDEFAYNYRRRNSYSPAGAAQVKSAVQHAGNVRQTAKPSSQPQRQPEANKSLNSGSTRRRDGQPSAETRKRSAANSHIPSANARDRKQTVVVKKDDSKKIVHNIRNQRQRRAVSNLMNKLDPEGKGAAWGASLCDSVKRIPVGMLFMMMLCAVSLMLIVSSSVLVSDASGNFAEAQDDVSVMAKQEDELLIALEVKNDLRTIENIAVNKLGMVKKDLVTRQYIKLSDEDVIETFEEEDRNIGLSTLLSAISKGN